ncbi:TIGR01458 family HAD-type hydrolase [Marinobacterium arenosum]|uniref:TIGR01458 family HAD-type hydrolase n=1 Tax=Marinobacterium arenosum TaxID=2862496 RepID=UPI001C96E326|nr:TIGR01458 family HAD-type hydrolase [Marinobacterium arenosum]MBY4675882.1 TIGR01458 family HAD-type hydrolase [Marinobacterium arenosum]
MPALLIDLDGVVYQGEALIPGARKTLQWLREEGIPHLFLTNTSSRPRRQICQRLAGMGIHVDEEEILTPVVAARHWIHNHIDGPVAAFLPDATREDLGDTKLLPEDKESGAACVLVGDLGERWDFATLNRAFRLLGGASQPPLLALGMTRYWRAEDGLRLDVGPFVEALKFASGREPIVLGKPAAQFFWQATELLGAEIEQALMIGDDIVGDVRGAQQAGLKAVQVRTGKFQPKDLVGSIEPDSILDSIAQLPNWLLQNS